MIPSTNDSEIGGRGPQVCKPRKGRHPLIRTLDRFGGRTILGKLITWMARRETGKDIRIFYDEVWMYRIGQRYLAKSAELSYPRSVSIDRAYRALYENCTDFWFYVYKPKIGDIIVDVGAGSGLDAPAFSEAVGGDGRVLAIEANPWTFRLLAKQRIWNQLNNMDVYQYAIMGRAGSVIIEDNRAAHTANRVVQGVAAIGPCMEVPAITLDEFCDLNGIDHIDFLKMNIEGAERCAIRGMQKILPRIQHICIACHDFLGDVDPKYRTRDEVIDFLRQSGFKVIQRDDPRDYVRDHVHGVREG